jgi:hypothetical protein
VSITERRVGGKKEDQTAVIDGFGGFAASSSNRFIVGVNGWLRGCVFAMIR